MHSPSSVAAAATTTAILLILISVAFSPCYNQLVDAGNYTCVQNFTCGQTNVSYPFWGGDRPQFCGHPSFELKCQNNEYPTIEIDNRAFRVQRINQSSNTMTLASSDLWEKATTIEISPTFTCEIGGVESHGIYANETLFNALKNYLSASCTKSVEVQVFRETWDKLLERSLTLQDGLRRGFEVEYDAACARCEGSGGICGSNSNEFACHCRDGTDPATCQSPGGGWNVGRKDLVLLVRL
ncbi:hypothetical protein C3L33_04208, partial [Rhododendron williamsianum]